MMALFDEALIIWRMALISFVVVVVLFVDISTQQASVLGTFLAPDALRFLLEYSRGRNKADS